MVGLTARGLEVLGYVGTPTFLEGVNLVVYALEVEKVQTSLEVLAAAA